MIRAAFALPLLALSAGAIGQAPPPPALAPAVTTLPAFTTLDVTAEGTVARVSDIATISAGVVVQARTAAAALAANAARMEAAAAALRRAGVADRDIRTAAIGLQPQYRYAENQPPVLTGYQATNQLSVRFRDVKRAGGILDALVEQGINQIGGPDFSVDRPDAALDEARVAAVRTARARAALYAEAAGLRVARILSISEGAAAGPPERPMMMMARASKQSADTAIEPGEQTLSVSVTVRFELR